MFENKKSSNGGNRLSLGINIRDKNLYPNFTQKLEVKQMDAIKKIIVLFLGAAGWITVVVMNLGFRDRDYSLGMEYLWLTIVLWGVALLLASLRGGYRD